MVGSGCGCGDVDRLALTIISSPCVGLSVRGLVKLVGTSLFDCSAFR